MSTESTDCMFCSTIIIIIVKKNPHIRGPIQFKPMLFKSHYNLKFDVMPSTLFFLRIVLAIWSSLKGSI